MTDARGTISRQLRILDGSSYNDHGQLTAIQRNPRELAHVPRQELELKNILVAYRSYNKRLGCDSFKATKLADYF